MPSFISVVFEDYVSSDVLICRPIYRMCVIEAVTIEVHQIVRIAVIRRIAEDAR